MVVVNLEDAMWSKLALILILLLAVSVMSQGQNMPLTHTKTNPSLNNPGALHGTSQEFRQEPFLFSPTDTNLEYVGHMGGTSRAVAVKDSYAFFGEGPQLTILDVSNSSSPTIVGKSTLLTYWIEDIELVGNYAYVAAYDAGLRVFDISNPVLPKEIGSYDTEGYANSVAVFGEYAYVADEWAGLRIINIANPKQPVEVGFYDLQAYAVVATDKYVYFASTYNGLINILDVSNPSAPSRVGHFASAFNVTDIQVIGSVIYAAEYSGLRVISASNPVTPTQISFYPLTEGVISLSVEGDHAYVLDRWDGIQIIDVGDPTMPIFKGSYTSGFEAFGIAVELQNTYIVGQTGLHIINIANPSSPTRAGGYDMPGTVTDVSVAGDFAYIADRYTGLHIVDISDPTVPFQVSQYSTNDVISDLVVRGDYLYMTQWEAGLRILNVSDRTQPYEVGYLDNLGPTRALALSGDHAYIASGEAGIKIINIKNPSQPNQVGTFNKRAYAIAISGEYAYATDSDNLRIIKISNPSEPGQVSYYNVAGNAEGVAVAGQHAYVAAYDKGLRIIDVSNPKLPTGASFYIMPGTVSHVTISGNYAYVSGGGTLSVLNIIDPLAPFLSAESNIGTWSADVQGEFAYTANGDMGLTVMRFDGNVPQVLITSFSPTAGVAGTSVTIKGINLNQVTAVRFNGTPATSFTILSPTELVAILPSGASTGPIGLTASTGTMSSQRIFTVTNTGTWTPLNVGSDSFGTTTTIDQDLIIEARSGDVWSTDDSFHYACQSSNGSIDLVMRLDEWNAGSIKSAKTGLMLRASGDSDAPHFAVHATGPDMAVKLKWRRNFGNTTTNLNGPSSSSLPLWLRLKKVDTMVTAYYSNDGFTWTQVGETMSFASLSTTFLSGVFVASNSPAQLASASYSASRQGEPTPTATASTSPTATNTSTPTPSSTATGFPTPTGTSMPTPTSTATGLPTPIATQQWLVLPFIIFEDTTASTQTSQNATSANQVPSNTLTPTSIPTNMTERTPIPPIVKATK